MTAISLTVSLKGAVEPLWRKVPANPQELEIINRNFSTYTENLFFNNPPTYYEEVSKRVEIAGLRQIALVVAFLLDVIVFAGRVMGCLPKATFPENPVKTVLRGLGAPEEVLKQVRVCIGYHTAHAERVPGLLRRDTRNIIGEYQINPEP